MAILVAGSGQYIIKQVERRRVEPLKIVEKRRQRVLWSGEDADESAEHQLEAALRLQRLELRDRRLLADDEPQFRDEVGHESTVRTERLEDSVAPHWTCLGKVESSSEGKKSISWASRSDGSGRNLRPKPFGWLR